MDEPDKLAGGINRLTADRDALLETIEELTHPELSMGKEEAAAQIARAKAEIDRIQIDIDKFDAG